MARTSYTDRAAIDASWRRSMAEAGAGPARLTRDLLVSKVG